MNSKGCVQLFGFTSALAPTGLLVIAYAIELRVFYATESRVFYARCAIVYTPRAQLRDVYEDCWYDRRGQSFIRTGRIAGMRLIDD